MFFKVKQLVCTNEVVLLSTKFLKSQASSTISTCRMFIKRISYTLQRKSFEKRRQVPTHVHCLSALYGSKTERGGREGENVYIYV